MSRVKIGIVGSRFQADCIAAAVKAVPEDAEIVAVASPTKGHAAEFAKRHGVPHAYTDYHDLLRRHDHVFAEECQHFVGLEHTLVHGFGGEAQQVLDMVVAGVLLEIAAPVPRQPGPGPAKRSGPPGSGPRDGAPPRAPAPAGARRG